MFHLDSIEWEIDGNGVLVCSLVRQCSVEKQGKPKKQSGQGRLKTVPLDFSSPMKLNLRIVCEQPVAGFEVEKSIRN